MQTTARYIKRFVAAGTNFGEQVSTSSCSHDGGRWCSERSRYLFKDRSSYSSQTLTASANRSAASSAFQPKLDPYGAALSVILEVIRSDTTT